MAQKFCHDCGKTLAPEVGRKFCPFCGVNLMDLSATRPQTVATVVQPSAPAYAPARVANDSDEVGPGFETSLKGLEIEVNLPKINQIGESYNNLIASARHADPSILEAAKPIKPDGKITKKFLKTQLAEAQKAGAADKPQVTQRTGRDTKE